MKYRSFAGLSLLAVLFSQCAKNNTEPDNSASLQKQVLSDFANVLALPNYQDIQYKANTLKMAVMASTSDFKNNIIGVLNAYLCKYKTDGHGLDEIVAAKNLLLHNKIQSQINAAIASFDAIHTNYGSAIYSHQVQIYTAQNLINTLKATLENDLMNFILINVKE
jgi:hypothetical protein